MTEETYCTVSTSMQLAHKGYPSDSTTPIPLHAAMDWLRKKHKIHVYPIPCYGSFEVMPEEYEDSFHGWTANVVELEYGNWIKCTDHEIYFSTFERACEVAIVYTLNNLI